MKNHFLSYIAGAVLMLPLGACDSQLDLVPKGQSTLDKTSDLELLLNQEWNLGDAPYSGISMICNEALGNMISIPEAMSSHNTLNYAYLAYDETVDRKTLSQADSRYSALYQYINYMNTLLTKIDDAAGDDIRKPQLKAEARIMRAYFHWLGVNIYARQYDPETAETDGGIAYVTDIDVQKTKEQLTVAETYRMILEDCSDEVIELLPDDNFDVVRPDKAFGNAVRAKVLMQMKRYAEALPYALKAIEINGVIEDRRETTSTGDWVLLRTVPNNYVWIGYGPLVCPTLEVLSFETNSRFESSDCVIRNVTSGGWDLGFGKMYSGLDGIRMFMGFSTQGNPWGITSDRMYYTAAECYIRTGELRKGLELVDKVRRNRLENYSSYALMLNLFPMDEKGAMRLMQDAKWIECLGSYENFFDTRRWNSEEAYAKTITRSLGEYGEYSISPDSELWITPFPANATRYNHSLKHNY